MTSRYLTCLYLHLLLCAPAFAAEPWTANTQRLAAGEAGAAAKITDLAWLAGTWRGAGLGGMNEEHWSAPAGGTIDPIPTATVSKYILRIALLGAWTYAVSPA